MKHDRDKPLCVWVAARDATQVIGLQAVPGRLPRMDLLPGETVDQLLRRAAVVATDGPDFWVLPISPTRTPNHA